MRDNTSSPNRRHAVNTPGSGRIGNRPRPGIGVFGNAEAPEAGQIAAGNESRLQGCPWSLPWRCNVSRAASNDVVGLWAPEAPQGLPEGRGAASQLPRRGSSARSASRSRPIRATPRSSPNGDELIPHSCRPVVGELGVDRIPNMAAVMLYCSDSTFPPSATRRPSTVLSCRRPTRRRAFLADNSRAYGRHGDSRELQVLPAGGDAHEGDEVDECTGDMPQRQSDSGKDWAACTGRPGATS